jgi:hypothetical protein
MNIPLILMAIGFTGLGIIKRKRSHKDWKPFLIGGIIMCVLAVVSIILSIVNR